MYSGVILLGIIIGILVSIPMGPIGVLCIQRTLHQGRISGFVSGLGAASADSFFAAIAGLGLSFISVFFQTNQFVIMLLGSAVLIFFGLKLFFTNPIKELRSNRFKKKNFFTDYLSVFFLTLSNPITIIFFCVVFAGLGIVREHPEQMPILLTGVFCGATMYWLLLTTIVNIFRKYFKLRIIFWINKVAGVIIVIFGLCAALNAFFPKVSQDSMEKSTNIQLINKLGDAVK